MNKILLSLLIPFSLCSMDQIKVNRHLICAPKGLGKIGLSIDNDGFMVRNNGSSTRVHNYDVDRSLRGMNQQRLEAIQKAGAAIVVNRLSNGEFALRMNPNLNGGGYWAGQALYYGTKTLCWAGVSAVATSTVSALAPTAGAASLGAGMVGNQVGNAAFTLGNQIAQKVGEKAITEASVAIGTQVAANSALAPLMSSMGALTIGIETVSIAAGAAGTACWWLP